jgi:hypothetical protein
MAMGTAATAERRIVYKQYAITATSFPRAGGWVPQAEVNDGRGAEAEAHSLTWKGVHIFATRHLADQQAFALGKRWADERR